MKNDELLVACDLCRTVINHGSATKRTVVTAKGPVTVMLCPTCMRLGSEDQTRKYIMKEEKDGRKEP